MTNHRTFTITIILDKLLGVIVSRSSSVEEVASERSFVAEGVSEGSFLDMMITNSKASPARIECELLNIAIGHPHDFPFWSNVSDLKGDLY